MQYVAPQPGDVMGILRQLLSLLLLAAVCGIGYILYAERERTAGAPGTVATVAGGSTVAAVTASAAASPGDKAAAATTAPDGGLRGGSSRERSGAPNSAATSAAAPTAAPGRTGGGAAGGGTGGGGAGGGRGGAGSRAVAVEVADAVDRDLDLRVEAVGTTLALQSIDVVPLSEGQVVEIEIVPGREVAAGDVIVKLDSGIEEASVAEAVATLDARKAALERSLTLVRSNSTTVSQATLDTLRADAAVAVAALSRAQRQLEDRTVRAPFNGVLGIRSIDVGARVETSTVLTTLDNLTEVEIEFSLPETVFGQIRNGQQVEATGAAFPNRSFVGQVSAIDTRVDPVSRAFRVRARLPNNDRALPVGMFMRLELALDSRRSVVVPEEALLLERGQPNVYLVVDGKAVKRPITVGLRRDGMVEVTEGVAAGDVVVARGIQSLRDGAVVNIIGRNPLPPVPNAEAAPVLAPEPVASTGGAASSGPGAAAAAQASEASEASVTPGVALPSAASSGAGATRSPS